MPDNQLVQFLRERKAALLREEEAQMQEMARHWLQVERTLEADMLRVADELSRNQITSQAAAMQNERLQRLLWQARGETARFNDWADGNITRKQMELAAQGIDDATQALQMTISTYFDRLPVESLNAMFGFAADGSPLANLLRSNYGEAVNGLLDALLKGLTLGNHPTDIGRMMAEEFGIGLQRALTIARTEQLRAYRAGSLEQYRNSGVTVRYKRMSARDERVCAGCLFSDGMEFETDHDFDEHPNGRCTMVPVVDGAEDMSVFESGQDWFRGIDPEMQQSILGGSGFDAWKNGTSLDDLFQFVNDPTWGGKFIPAPVGKIGQ
jgi:SPP1 gp7 family putative phage head morphogenesis protein